MEKQCEAPSTIVPEEDQFFFYHELLEEYREYRKSDNDIKVMLVTYVLCISFYFLRCNVANHVNDGFFFTCSFVCLSISSVMCLIFVICKVMKAYGTDVISQAHVVLPVTKFLEYFYEDTLAILGSTGVSINLYARVASGKCMENVTIWESQRCNPGASVSGLPLDHTMFLFLLPTFCASLLNGMTFRGTIIVWLIGTLGAIFSMIRLSSSTEIFALLVPLTIIVTLYRYEKLTRITFSNNRKKVAAEMEKQKYILLQQQAEQQLAFEMNKHELVILAMKAEEECRLMEKEKEHMLALIGNIAHDLKTPLQSFLVDLEQLRSDPDLSTCKILRMSRDKAIKRTAHLFFSSSSKLI